MISLKSFFVKMRSSVFVVAQGISGSHPAGGKKLPAIPTSVVGIAFSDPGEQPHASKRRGADRGNGTRRRSGTGPSKRSGMLLRPGPLRWDCQTSLPVKKKGGGQEAGALLRLNLQISQIK